LLDGSIPKFNSAVVEGGWGEEEDLASATSTPIAELDEIVTIDDDVDE
jgi:hypothetical protein